MRKNLNSDTRHYAGQFADYFHSSRFSFLKLFSKETVVLSVFTFEHILFPIFYVRINPNLDLRQKLHKLLNSRKMI